MPTLDLSGTGWSFRATDAALLPKAQRGLAKWLPATVPGTAQGQLLAQGLIADPYQGRSELDLQWLDTLDWEFRRSIEASEADCRRGRQELVFEGLDTVASVLLNGQEVGRSANMFRTLVCDVRKILKPGANELIVRLGSPNAYAAAEAARHPDHPVTASPALQGNRAFAWQTGERRQTDRPWIRKVQCHFGWDWGVCLPPSGIWMPCRLELSDAPRLVSVTVAQRHVGPAGAPLRVELTVNVRLSHNCTASGAVVVGCGSLRTRIPARVVGGEGLATATLVIEKPVLWWPNGAGEQVLYELTARWEGDDAGTVRRRIGLRSIELVTEADAAPDGSPGQSMAFKVNGRPLFMKGADWIPPDQFVERCTPDLYRDLLGAMAGAHMNMVRVWGGGWYELDAFYDICDELGILVWQDFMMACALFPDTPGFIAEIAAEARDQVRRLQHRACLALWCGDNENLTGVNHWWKDPKDPERIRAGYTRLMTELRGTVSAEDPTRRFWVSSPSNGWIDRESESPNSGDVHYWAVWHGRRPFSDYHTVRPRFASEFGFQAFAEPATMRAYVPADGLNLSSREMEHHQRSGDGNQLIANTVARELPIPDGFDSWCWASQINQANAIGTAVEHWRRLKPWCMGTLYWQINDIWPVASWSSIDWLGRWKALHHAAKRFNAPLLVSLVHDQATGEVAVWATSDLPRKLHLAGAIEAVGTDGKRLGRIALTADLAADASREIARVKVADLLAGRAEPFQAVVFAELEGDGISGGNHLNLVPWKHLALSKPKLSAQLAAGKGGVALTLKTDAVAPFVHAWVEGTESHFDGSFAVLRPGRTYRLPLVEHRLRGQKPISLAQAKKGLRLISLWDLAWREK